MVDTHRIMIRLSPELYAQLEARGSQGQPLAAIVRQALVDYLARQPEQPEQPDDIRLQLMTLRTQGQDLETQVRALTARVDALTAPEQPRAARSSPRAAASSQVAASEQPRAATQQPQAATPRQHHDPPPRHGLPPETLEAIANERTHCEGLTLGAFAQHLHAKGIYSATAKDGSKVPANRGTLKKLLDRAREAGVL